MTGKGHSWTGFACAIAVYKFSLDFGFNPYLAIPAFLVGVTAPDWLEIRKSGGGTVIKHRTITHWLPLWIALFAATWFSVELGVTSAAIGLGISETVLWYIRSVLIGFSLGGLLHLLTDIPNPMGIPILTPTRRFSFKLWKSGKYEVAITFVLLLISLYYVGIIEFNGINLRT